MEEKKTHKFPKNGSETGQVTSSNYVMTLCLIEVISNNNRRGIT